MSSSGESGAKGGLTAEQLEARESARVAIALLNRQLREGRRVATEVERLDPERQAALADLRQDIELKRSYARGLFRLLLAQLGIADAVFIVYAWAGQGWHLAPSVIQVWLAATLVEVVGVVTVVTRYLFPRRDKDNALVKFGDD